MTRTDEELDYIARYLNRQLNSKQQQVFETRLTTDAEWALDVDTLGQVRSLTERQQVREQIRRIQTRKLAEWQTETPDTRSSGRRFLGRWAILSWAAAASVALVAGFLFLSDVRYERLAETAERSSIPVAPDPVLRRLNEGIALLEADQAPKALVALQEVGAVRDLRPFYRDAASWYEVVALLKANRMPEARRLLNQIETSPDFRYPISRLDHWKVKCRLLF